jgi:hypothetical protein
MDADPYSTVVILELTIAEIVALLACASRYREVMPLAQRRALRTAMYRLSMRGLRRAGRAG